MSALPIIVSQKSQSVGLFSLYQGIWSHECHVFTRNHYQDGCFADLYFWFVGISMCCTAIISTWDNRSHAIFLFFCVSALQMLFTSPPSESSLTRDVRCFLLSSLILLQQSELNTYRYLHRQVVEGQTSTLTVVLKRKRD